MGPLVLIGVLPLFWGVDLQKPNLGSGYIFDMVYVYLPIHEWYILDMGY